MADVVDNLNTLAKEVFAEGGVPDLVPNGCKVQQLIPFKQKELLGLKYVQVVRLAYPTGFTHALGDGTAGAFALNSANAGAQGRAEIQGAQMVLKDQMSYEDAAKVTGGKQSFVAGTDYFFEGMQMSAKKRNEVEMLYGQSNLGAVSSCSVSTNATITFTSATWAPGIWLGCEGMALDVYDADDSTKLNTNADLVLVSVNNANKQIVVSGNSSDLNAIDAGDLIYYKGAHGNEAAGIRKIMANTGSLFGINGSTYGLWVATQYAPTSGAFTFAKLKKGLAQAVGKGLDEDIKLLVSPGAWSDLADNIESLRKTDKSETTKVEVGTEEITYKSQNGKTEIIASLYMKEGEAMGLVPSQWKRIGARDITFKTPGFNDQMFFHLPSNAGVEARMYSNQAPFCFSPNKQILFQNIVNTVI